MTAPGTKISSKWLQEELTAIKDALRIHGLYFAPAACQFYKPSQSGGGHALTVQVRMSPEFKGKFVRATGGVFFGLAPQKPEKDPKGNALFDWDNALTAKLGIADLSQLLYAMRCRILRIPVSDKDPGACNLFHKFQVNGVDHTTAIKYELQKTGAILGMSKSKTERGSISLTLPEELVLELYLQHALHLCLLTGKR